MKRASAVEDPSAADGGTSSEGLVERDGMRFVGTHLLVDLWEAENLDDPEQLAATLRAAVSACGATLLRLDLHRFGGHGGISGVAVLAESHLSVHTWPELGYAAIDIFVCGACDPYRAIAVLRRALRPRHVQLTEQRRGVRA